MHTTQTVGTVGQKSGDGSEELKNLGQQWITTNTNHQLFLDHSA